tara:strand:- start:1163 stop:1348 length:186 start_codon:yes stop_codon:yes gene_type:complete
MKKPTIELKSNKFTEVIELERKFTPNDEKKLITFLLKEEKYVSTTLKDLLPKSTQVLKSHG